MVREVRRGTFKEMVSEVQEVTLYWTCEVY